MTVLPPGADNRIYISGYSARWSDLDTEKLIDAPDPAAFLVADNAAAARAVWSHATGRRETLIAAAARVDPVLEEELRDAGFAIVAADRTEDPVVRRGSDPGRIWLLTSGSTGRPKQVAHTLESLTTVSGTQPARTWLCPYTPGAYAWWQVVTLSLNLPGQDVVFVESDEMDDWPRLAVERGVTAASGTPTFWRQALWRSAASLAKLPLQQITLGGEPVDQSILTRLRDMFPTARISWIYASSEAGAAIAVHDGLAGFPASWLGRETTGRPVLAVDNGELIITSRHAAAGDSAPVRTGDRAEIVEGRVLITGRIASDEINVGGSKASAGRVREVLLAHPSVAWAGVRGRKAPLVGNVVVAEVVFRDDAAAVEQSELVAWCAERLPDYSVPRRLRILTEIPMKETLKSDV